MTMPADSPAQPVELETCKWPDPEHPCARARAPRIRARGPAPDYCEQADGPGQPAHDAGTAWRWKQQHAAGRASRPVSDAERDAPHSMARAESGLLLDRADRLAAEFQVLLTGLQEAIATAGSPEAARAEVEAGRIAAAQQVATAEGARLEAERRASDAERDMGEANDAAGVIDGQLTAERQRARELTDRLGAQAAEHGEQLRAAAERHAAELGQVRSSAETRVREAEEDAVTRISELQEAHATELARVTEDATTRIAAAAIERDDARRQAAQSDDAVTRALEDAAEARGRAEQAIQEAERAQAAHDRQVDQMRADAARERDQAAALLTQARDAATTQIADLRGRASQLDSELERERQTAATDREEQRSELERARRAAATDREELKSLYEGMIADLRAALADSRRPGPDASQQT